MSTHFRNLLESVPDLRSRKILDLGSGAGDFLIECAKEGCDAAGLELNLAKVDITREKAAREGIEITVEQGQAEQLPFNSDEFDFVNAAEVIEHVGDPDKVLAETYRVMKVGALAYMSAHNRFGLYDTHFHTYFLGWMPRKLGEKYLTLLGKNKEYEAMPDAQRISEMHYHTFGQFKKLAQDAGFQIEDIRERKVQAKWGVLGMLLYKALRPWYFSTFHFLLRK